MGNPTIDLPAEASPEEILAQKENAQFPGGNYDVPAEATPTDIAYAKLIQQRFSQPQQEERGAVSRFAGAAGGAAIGALGGGDAASAVEIMSEAAKRSKILQPLLSAGGGWGEQALGLLHDAAHDWAMGANQVKQWALPDAARKGDIAERGGEIAGVLAGLGGVAALGKKMGVKAFEGLAAHGADALGVGSKLSGALFGAAGLAMTGAGQQAAPVYFHVLAKTGDEEKAIQAAMPALGIGATYALPLGKIIAGAGAGTFGKLLLSGLGEGALGASQAVATDAILKKATGEQMSFLKDGAEAGGFGFLTTTILGMLHMAGAKVGKAGEAKPAKTSQTSQEAPGGAEARQGSQEAPGAKQAEGAPAVTEAERAWAERFLARPEPKEGSIGAPSLADEALANANEAEKAGGKRGTLGSEVPTRKVWPANAKPSLTEPLPIDPFGDGSILDDRLTSIGRDYGIAVSERSKAHGELSAAPQTEKGKADTFTDILDRWQAEGRIPKQVEEALPQAPETPQGKKTRLSGAIDSVGKAVGATDEQIANARRRLEKMPAELDAEEEFMRIANDLRKKAQGSVAPGEEKPVGKEEPLLAPALEESSRTRSPDTGSPLSSTGGPGSTRPAQDLGDPRSWRINKRGDKYILETATGGDLGEFDTRDLAEKWKAAKIALHPSTQIVAAVLQGRPQDTVARAVDTSTPKPDATQENIATQKNLELLNRIDDAAQSESPGPGTIETIYKALGLPPPKDPLFKSSKPTNPLFRIGAYRLKGGRADLAVSRAEIIKSFFRDQAEADGLDPDGILGPMSGLSDADKRSRMSDATARADRTIAAILDATNPTAADGAQLVTQPPKPDATQELLYGGLPPLFQSKDVSSGSVQKALNDGLRKRGAVPEVAFLANERAAHEVNARAQQKKIVLRRIERAVKKLWGKAAGGAEANARIQEALTDPDKMMALPESIRKHVIEARALIDANSRAMVDEGMVDKPMRETFEKNQGEYLRQQYQAHSDPKWAQKIEPEVRNRLKSLLLSWAEPLTPEKTKELRDTFRGPKYRENIKNRRLLLAQIEALKPHRSDPAIAAQITDLRAQRKAIKAEMRQKSMPQREAAFELGTRKALQGKSEEQVVGQMDAMLSDAADVANNPWAAVGASNLKRKDLSIFKLKKGLPDEMKAFLGDIKDPLANLATTLMKQAQVIAAHHKFQAMRADGMGKWLFEEPITKNGVKYTAKVSSGDNPALEPLVKGKTLYTSEEIKKALFATQPADANKGWKLAIAMNAALKAGKAVWSPVTIAKQVHQNFTAALRLGHVHMWGKYGKEALAALTGHDEAGLLDAIRHGLIGESVAGVEFRDLKNTLGDKTGTVFGKKLHPVYEGARSAAVGANQFVGALFQYPDGFAKIAGWKVETARLVENGMNEAQAKLHAADIIRNTYPTAGRIGSIGHGIGPAIDKWRKQPIFGTFMGWNSEKIRTTAELYKLIREDLKSGSPERRAHGLKRIGWAIAGEAALPASVLAYNMLNGIDKQEDADRREHTAPWDRGKNIFWTGSKDKGSYIVASDIDSNAWTTDSALRLIAGDKIEDILADAYREDLAPFIDPSMLSKTIVEQIQGKDFDTGVKKPRMDLLFKRVKPGVAQAVELKKGDWGFNSSKATQQLVGLSGIKPQSYDVRESLKYTSYDFLDGLREAKDSEPKRREVFAAASKKAQSAIRLGLSFDDVRSILHESGLGQETIDAILTGGYRPYKPRKKAD